MKQGKLITIISTSLLVFGLAACGFGQASGATNGDTTSANGGTGRQNGNGGTSTGRQNGNGTGGTGGTGTGTGRQNGTAGNGGTGGQQVNTLPTPQPTVAIARGISAIGEVEAAQDANLTFVVQGTIDQVMVKEGDLVKKGQILASLDTRSFDQKVIQAQAALDIAKAAQTALTDPAKPGDLASAQAQVRQAQIALTQAKISQPQNVRSAASGVTAAQASLQAQRDKLSQAKTSAESNLEQAALALTKAQSAYAKAKSDWEYYQQSGNNPAQPTTTNAQGKQVDNKLTDSAAEQYYATFVQAEASMHQAELALQQAQVDAQAARQAEVTGIQAAEQNLVQAQSSYDKLNSLPNSADTIAQAQATLDQAKANLLKLTPAPSGSDLAKADAGTRQAQAALDSAKLDREHAELHAPFDGIIAQVNINPGDPSATAGQVPIQMIDTSKLHIDAAVNAADISQIAVGQTTQISAETSSNKPLTGKVGYIAPAATISGNLRTYVVRIDLDDQGDLRAGMSVRVAFPQKH